MPRRRVPTAAAVLLLACGTAGAQTPATSPASPAAAQPTLPSSSDSAGLPATSPIVGGGTQPLTVRKKAAEHRAPRRRARVAAAAYREGRYDDLDRPALAGVELVTPIPHPIQPPHHTVPVPGYPLENLITFYTAPPPPVVCRRVPRDPYAPDPNLLREKTVVCAADNP